MRPVRISLFSISCIKTRQSSELGEMDFTERQPAYLSCAEAEQTGRGMLVRDIGTGMLQKVRGNIEGLTGNLEPCCRTVLKRSST